MVKYNRDGDLFFSCSKDSHPSVWYAHNGERLGSYEGHNGAVWGIDVSYDTRLVLTGSADSSACIWEAKTGRRIKELVQRGPVRGAIFNLNATRALLLINPFAARPAYLSLFEVPKEGVEDMSDEPLVTTDKTGMSDRKGFGSVAYAPMDRHILVGCEDGVLRVFHPETLELLQEHRLHSKVITDIQFDTTQGVLVTSSADCTAKLLDADSYEVLHTFKSDRPVNTAAISPRFPHLILGGGQDARSVTTTSAASGKFEAQFWHLIFGHEFARVAGHFGPINTAAFNPDGRSYISGAEDGYLRLHFFDDSYFVEAEREETEFQEMDNLEEEEGGEGEAE